MKKENKTEKRKVIVPYLSIGFSTTCRGISKRSDIKRNLRHIENMIPTAMFVVSINMPIKIVAVAEGVIFGFTDETFDVPHVTTAKDLFIDIPGEETEFLGNDERLILGGEYR